jgi:hypothetical protein
LLSDLLVEHVKIGAQITISFLGQNGNRSPYSQIKVGLSTCPPSRFITVAIDDTDKRKCGKQCGQTSWMKDPLSPPFHVNLQHGLRFVHAAMLMQHHDKGQGCHAASVAFKLCPPVKKPGKNATKEDWVAVEV